METTLSNTVNTCLALNGPNSNEEPPPCQADTILLSDPGRSSGHRLHILDKPSPSVEEHTGFLQGGWR